MGVPEGYEDNDAPVRSPFNTGITNNISDQDEDDYSTLLILQGHINEAVAELHNVNVFDLKEDELNIKEQMAAYRKAEEIVTPLQILINDTVNTIKQKEGN